MEDNKKEYIGKNALLYVWNKIKTLLGNKVDKEKGKGLSTNDFTDDYKNKIDNASSGKYTDLPDKPQINNHELVSGNNTLESLGIEIPDVSDLVSNTELEEKQYQTANDVETTLSDKHYATETFVTDKGYQTSTDVEKAINSKISSAVKYKGDVQNYTELPEDAQNGDLYNIVNESEHNRAGDNAIWNEEKSQWDIQAGTIDTSNFIINDDLVEITNEEIDEIFALE